MTDASQVAIFIRAIHENFHVIEKLLGLESLLGISKRVDLFNILKKCIERSELDCARLGSIICTDDDDR